MTYAEITREDPSALKRFVQRRRYRDAAALLPENARVRRLADFGAADGEFSKTLARRFPQAAIFCYEPSAEFRAEAEQNLVGLRTVQILAETQSLPSESLDAVFCLEVLEHLPPAQSEEVLRELHRLLAPGGLAIIGVPIEVGPPALAKGIFRMTRRCGAFDATPANILRAAFGRPPTDRPLAEIPSGPPYYSHHLGFDHRQVRSALQLRFRLLRSVPSPFPWLGPSWNSEIHFLAEKPTSDRGDQSAGRPARACWV